MLTISLQHDELAQQARVECNLLQLLIEGLRAALAWRVNGDDCTRKLATMRFIARSFQRHLERVMYLEEVDGYMDIVLEKKPFLIGRVDSLKMEHKAFRRNTASIVHRLGRVNATDRITLDDICEHLGNMLDRLDSHLQSEARLFCEAFEQEEGGEG